MQQQSRNSFSPPPPTPAQLGRSVLTTRLNGSTTLSKMPFLPTTSLRIVKDESNIDLDEEASEQYIENQAFKSEIERFIEISKYFSSPVRKTASYICENRLVAYPNPYRIEYKRGGITTEHIKFSNLTLEPVYVKFFKLTPDIEEIKFINLALSRCKRIPPGLSFNLGFVYDDVNENIPCNTKMIFVASRKTTTPCYQMCEIALDIDVKKRRVVAT